MKRGRRGRIRPSRLAAIDKDPAGAQAIHAWGEREGTYRLPIEVEEEHGWKVRGALPNGGPLLAEDRAILLDISHARGAELRIRMRPPVGYWAFNSFAVAYGPGQEVKVVQVAANSAKTSGRKDILRDLAVADDRYYPMPDESEQAEITFPAPARKVGQDRTIFLHSRLVSIAFAQYKRARLSHVQQASCDSRHCGAVRGGPVCRVAAWRGALARWREFPIEVIDQVFAIGFPGPVKYRIFVPIERNGHVDTSVLDAAVDWKSPHVLMDLSQMRP